MTKLTNPTPLFLNARGALLDGGRIFVGAAGANPSDQPVSAYWDEARTIPAAQPLRTRGGAIVNDGARAFVFVGAADYSMRIEDADGNLVDYVASVAGAAPAYQPQDADLSAIAQLATTPFGRGLLTIGNAAALRQAAAIPAALPLAGGEVTGGVTRAGGGAHGYWAAPAMTSGRRFLTPASAADPTSLPGDEWLKY